MNQNNMTQQQMEAIAAARYELVTLNGLVAADGAAPEETWVITTTTDIVNRLDNAFSNQPEVLNCLIVPTNNIS